MVERIADAFKASGHAQEKPQVNTPMSEEG
jgi:hypothetical protein